MPRVKLVLEYDGTAYVGWQAQANGPSIQARVEGALQQLTGAAVEVVAAGRTDSGVHARGQVVAADVREGLPLKAFKMGLNGLLPEDIAVVQAEFVDAGFDPRRHATGKRYAYAISNLRYRSPLRRRTHWELFQPLDVEAMRRALPSLLGRHDFSAFRAADCQAAHAMREIRRIELTGTVGDELILTVEGTAFLKHMVRNIAGSVAHIGRGKAPADWLGQVLAGRDRTLAGPTAPPHGLCLIEVQYAGARVPNGELDE